MTLKIYKRSKRFERNFKKLPQVIKDAFYNQFQKFHTNHPVMHPSLRIKGVHGKKGIYEMTVTMDIRATFEYIEDGVLFRNIGSHDETIKNA
jgi:mRNA-degrading endonuclease YafQ of YafQ-DinJ toxin-antitoxin module